MVEITLVALPVPVFDQKAEPRPALTDELVAAAEASLGVELPSSYLDLLRRDRNGGPLRRGTYRTGEPIAAHGDPWVASRSLMGVGGSEGLENQQWLIDAWDVGATDDVGFDVAKAVLFAADGQDFFLFDYGRCDEQGEPAIVYVYVDAEIEATMIELNFGRFAAALRTHGEDQPSWVIERGVGLDEVVRRLASAGVVPASDDPGPIADLDRITLTDGDGTTLLCRANEGRIGPAFPEYGDAIDLMVRTRTPGRSDPSARIDDALEGIAVRVPD